MWIATTTIVSLFFSFPFALWNRSWWPWRLVKIHRLHIAERTICFPFSNLYLEICMFYTWHIPLIIIIINIIINWLLILATIREGMNKVYGCSAWERFQSVWAGSDLWWLDVDCRPSIPEFPILHICMQSNVQANDAFYNYLIPRINMDIHDINDMSAYLLQMSMMLEKAVFLLPSLATFGGTIKYLRFSPENSGFFCLIM